MERENSRVAQEASLIQLAASSIFSKKGRDAFKKRLDALAFEVKPHKGRFEIEE